MRKKPILIDGNVVIAIDDLLKRLLEDKADTKLSLKESLALEEFSGLANVARNENIFVDAILECIEEDKRIEEVEENV